ncbi:MAG: hypothetical protein AAGJ34_09655 [Pseudomonadota bacterium]
MFVTKRPLPLLLGCAVAVFVAGLTAYSLAVVIFDHLPRIQSNMMIRARAPEWSVFALSTCSILISLIAAHQVFEGRESGRTTFLIWTSAGFALGVALTRDPEVLLLEVTLAVVVLLMWFLPSSSWYLSGSYKDTISPTITPRYNLP